MPKRYFKVVTILDLHAALIEQTGSDDYTEVSRKAWWECPSCQAAQTGEHLPEDMPPLEVLHSASTKCVACGFDAEADPEKSEYEIENPNGPNLPRFRPYSVTEAEAHRERLT